MDQIIRERAYPGLKRDAPGLRLSPLLRIVVVMVIGLAVVSLGVRALAQFAPASSSPFPAYTDVYPGQSASAVQAREPLCLADYADAYHPEERYCGLMQETGFFSRVSVEVSDGIIDQTTFMVRRNTLTVGDLARWLETPVVHWNAQVVFFLLPNHLVRVVIMGQPKRFSFFLPVWSITVLDRI
jgi:hypothetical protein